MTKENTLSNRKSVWTKEYTKEYNRQYYLRVGKKKQAQRRPTGEILCACGCSKLTHRYDNHGRERRYIHGHNQKGETHWQWKGGRQITKKGYVIVQAKGHPRATWAGYVFEHILVMEEMIGRRLEPNEEVHHINGNKQDNRRENLELFQSHSEHMERHKKKRA